MTCTVLSLCVSYNFICSLDKLCGSYCLILYERGQRGQPLYFVLDAIV